MQNQENLKKIKELMKIHIITEQELLKMRKHVKKFCKISNNISKGFSKIRNYRRKTLRIIKNFKRIINDGLSKL